MFQACTQTGGRRTESEGNKTDGGLPECFEPVHRQEVGALGKVEFVNDRNHISRILK